MSLPTLVPSALLKSFTSMASKPYIVTVLSSLSLAASASSLQLQTGQFLQNAGKSISSLDILLRYCDQIGRPSAISGHRLPPDCWHYICRPDSSHTYTVWTPVRFLLQKARFTAGLLSASFIAVAVLCVQPVLVYR